MIINLLLLIICLSVIVLTSHIFCNSLEHLGKKLKISDGVTGSLFAAVGTALPETIIPILALSQITHSSHNKEIGVGAILGAPFMLSTLSLFIMAIFTLKKRGINGALHPERRGVLRDLRFFLLSYSLAFSTLFIQHLSFHKYLNFIAAFTLGLIYFIYVLLTIKQSISTQNNNHVSFLDPLLLNRYCLLPVNYIVILLQLFLGLGLLLIISYEFIDLVSNIANIYHVSSFLIALIIVPIATELPEKINSILWLRGNKDTLAIANITGAMVFQGSLLPIVGIMASDNWGLSGSLPIFSIITTIIATLWFYYNVQKNNIKLWHFIINGILYTICIAISIHCVI